ncbi:MAG: CmcJ/NvfI family oxidoreductase [Pseudomonadota bacterium]|nr:CmcJ/NvfI family oxidoreductase [Pseudomonadota bacterium]
MDQQYPHQIKASLSYGIDDGVMPVNETKDMKTKIPSYTGNFDQRAVPISNGRQTPEKLNLESNGFELVEHNTKIKNFINGTNIESAYYSEIEELIKKHTDAWKVVIFDHTIRTGNEIKREKMLLREPVQRVHNDYTEWSGPQRVRDIIPGKEAEKLLKKRFAIIQVWRPIQPKIESNPLALCDAQSLNDKDLIITERRYPDRIGQTYQVKYNANHSWFYFPEMKKNEAIIFKVYDSEKDGRSRFTAHTSFEDPTTPDNALPRESIEVRALTFFN